MRKFQVKYFLNSEKYTITPKLLKKFLKAKLPHFGEPFMVYWELFMLR